MGRRVSLLVAVALLLAPASLRSGQVISAAQEASGQGLVLIGQSAIDGSRFGDIWVHDRYAYLGTSSCGSGAKVVDVSDPSRPRLVASLTTSQQSTHEDLIVIHATTPFFQGNLLAVGIQSCSTSGRHGVQFWDVTDPLEPRMLSFFDTGGPTRGVHELYLFQRGDRVLALLAVPRSESSSAGGDFRILDVTNPRQPRQIADWGILAGLSVRPAHEDHLRRDFFCHSVWANEDGTVAYLSYWDAGVVMLDISNPQNPRFMGKTEYDHHEEGNAHSAWPVGGTNLLLVTDEDFNTRGAALKVTAPAILATELHAEEPTAGSPLCATPDIDAEIVYARNGCKPRHYPVNTRGKVVLVESDGCGAPKKMRRAQEAGALALLMAVRSQIFFGGRDPGINIPVATVTPSDADYLIGSLSGSQSVRVKLADDPLLSGWGLLHIYDTSDPANPREVGSFATPNSRVCPQSLPGVPGGRFTVHNPFVIGTIAYLSWYADGVRLVDISDPSRPVEIAHYVPPGVADVWGVYPKDDLVFLSDISAGLYILRRVQP